LFIPDKNGVVLYNELIHIEKQHKVRDKRLDNTDPPEEAKYIFDLYWSKFRGTEITFQEIKAFEEVMGIKLESWEIDLLFVIHKTVESHIAEMLKS